MARVSRGMRERRSVDPRVLQLKIRVRAPRGTTRDQLIQAVQDASETGMLAPGFTVHWIDWQKGTGGTALSGRLTTNLQAALRDFFRALTDPATRLRVERAE